MTITECASNYFDQQCKYFCHCGAVGCNNSTGFCDNPQNRCDVDWIGPSCSGKNGIRLLIICLKLDDYNQISHLVGECGVVDSQW